MVRRARGWLMSSDESVSSEPWIQARCQAGEHDTGPCINGQSAVADAERL